MMSSKTKYGHLTDGDESGIPDTHRRTKKFPAGDETDVTCDDIPDNESDLGMTFHYEHESRKRTNPDVTDEIVDELLNDSEVREPYGDDYPNRLLLQKEIDGYEWTLVIADDEHSDEEKDWVLITIYCTGHGSVGTTNAYFDRYKDRKMQD